MDALLGIDLGTGSVKALVISVTGEAIGRGGAEYGIDRPIANAAEQDPGAWRRSTIRAVRQALLSSGSPNIVAIGLSGQMHGTVLIDRKGSLVRPAIIWADGRSVAQALAISQEIGSRAVIETAGSPVVAGFQAATCRWISEHEPENWAKTAFVLTPKDELRRWMTGEISTEPSDASATLLFDVNRLDWSPPLLEAARLRRDQLPEVRRSDAVSGTLAAGVAEAFGLPAGIPVSGGVADAPGAALGAGVNGLESLLLTISTGAQALIPVRKPMIDLKGRIHSFCGPLAEPAWYAMGATMAAGMALRWLRDRIFELKGPEAYASMMAAAETVGPGSNGLLFLPYLAGERTPLMDPGARGVFLGLTGEHGRAHLIRAVLEGVAFSVYDAFQVLRGLGANPGRIVLAGGGARAPLWRQIMADVFELPVIPALDPDQSAIGAAMTAGAAIGAITLAEASRSWPQYDAEVVPISANSRIYHELLPLFRTTYAVHKHDFQQLSAIGPASN